MKKQIKRLSPHKNAKIICVAMAVGMMPLHCLTTLPGLIVGGEKVAGFAKLMLFVTPFFYLVSLYVVVGLFCMVYNFLSKYLGCIEMDVAEGDAASS